MANSTFGDTSQALLHAASTSALQIISSSTTSASTTSGPAVTEWSAEGEPAGECVSMNDLLWHYRQDLTTRPLIMGLFAICYSVIIFLGIVGNICVILAISRTRSLQTVPNMFIFSLSCSDVVVCCTSATITPITAFQKEWLFGTFLCSVAPFIAGVSLCFSTFTLAAISLDRFMLIRFPMKKPFSHVQAFSIICLICVLAMAMSVPVMFMQTLKPLDKYCGQFCYEDWGANANQRRAYGTLMLTLQFIIPLVVIVFCYTAISLRLGQSVLLKSKKKQQGSGYEWQLQMSDQQRTATKRRQRTNRMFIAMVVAFSLSWIWTLMFNLLRDYEILPEFVKDQEFFFGILTHCIAMTSTVWNPFVYAFLNLQLRAAFWQLMPQCLKQCLETKISDEKAAAKNGGPVQTMNLSGQQGRERANKQSFKRRQSSPVKSARRFSQKPANVNGGLLLATGELRPGHRDYEEDSTASINLVEGNESPITTATSALMEPSLVQNSGNAKYGSFDVVAPVYTPVPIPSFEIGLVREGAEELMKAQQQHFHPSAIAHEVVPGARIGATGAGQPPQTVLHNLLKPDTGVQTQQPFHDQWPGDRADTTSCCDHLIASAGGSPQKAFIKELVNSWSAACDQRERRLSGQLSQTVLASLAQPSSERGRGVWALLGAPTLNPYQPIHHPSRLPIPRGHRHSLSIDPTLQQQYGKGYSQSGRLGRRKSDWPCELKCPLKEDFCLEEVFNGRKPTCTAPEYETGEQTAHDGTPHCAFCENHTARQCWSQGCECCTCCTNRLKVAGTGPDSVDYQWNKEKRTSTRARLQEYIMQQLSNSTNSQSEEQK